MPLNANAFPIIGLASCFQASCFQDKDTGIGMFVPAITRKEPESAADWAATIQSPDARQTALRQVFAAWPDKDSATAYYAAKGWPVE